MKYLLAYLLCASLANGQTQAKRPVQKPIAKIEADLEDSVPAEGKALKNACDTQASHPADKTRPVGVRGVPDDRIVAGPAIKACLQASTLDPENARYQFQLGRAYWAAKQYDPALDAFLKAQEKEFAPAYFYIGEAYQQGLVKGEKADEEFAVDLYQEAAANGFLPAKNMLAPEEEAGPPKIDAANGYSKPEWMEAIYTGKMDSLTRARADAMVYIGGVNKMASEYSSQSADDADAAPDEACAALADNPTSAEIDHQNLGIPLNPNFMDVLKLMADRDLLARVGSPEFKAKFQNGIDDMYIFISDAGGCSAPAVHEAMKNLQSFVRRTPGR